jgi:hypothetical protein
MIILGAVIIVIAILALVIHRQPDDFTVSRAATMNAPPEKIFPHVNNLPNWHAWSPWAKLDPNAKTTFEGPTAGVGAKMAWEGNNQVGSGSMTILESRTNERIKFQLDFLKPMRNTHFSEFTFTRQGNQTLVTWTMTGKSKFIGKAMTLVMDCKKMIHAQFDKGLASLKAIVES